jgi:hypothetical protein
VSSPPPLGSVAQLERPPAFCTLRRMHKHLACLLLLAATTLGCQVKPGEYRIYRLAFNPISSECSPAEATNPDHTYENNLFGTGLVAIYAADADTYFLENGMSALLGARDGSDYTFTANETTIDNWKTTEGYSRNFTATLTRDSTVNLTLKGKGLNGVFEIVEDQQCGGSTMDCQIANAVPKHCEYVTEVFGTEVDDVDIEYVLGGGGLP